MSRSHSRSRASSAAFFPLSPAPLALAVAMTLAAPGAVHAQATGWPDAPVPFSIGAQPLGQALGEWALKTGLQLIVQPELVSGKTAPAVAGSLTPRQALDRLLAGSGLSARVDGRAVIVHKAAAEPETGATLGTVTVTAQAERSGATEGTGSYTTRSTSAATGLNLSLRETPQSVSVVTRQRMDEQGLNSLTDVLTNTVGVYHANQSNPVGAYNDVYSRGYTITNYQVDGEMASRIAYTQNIMAIDTSVYDSVTVVRGATGLMTGAGNPSGSVNLTRKRPTRELQTIVEAGIGSWDKYRAMFDIGSGLNTSGSIRARLVAAHDRGGSPIENYKGRRTTLYGIIEADLTDRTLLTLSHEHYRQRTENVDGDYGFPIRYSDTGAPTPYGRNDIASADWGQYQDARRNNYNLRLDHQINDDWKVSLNYAHGEIDTDYKRSSPYYGGIRSDGTPNSPWSAYEITNYKTNTFDVNLKGSYYLWGRKHDLAAGANGAFADTRKLLSKSPSGSDARVIDGRVRETEPDWDSISNTGAGHTNTDQSGFYVSTRVQATDDLSVILGGRLSNWETRTYSDFQARETQARKDKNVFTPYTGLVYDLTGSLSAYASYTTIFNPVAYAKDADDNMLDPEEGVNYEVGLKDEWFEGRLNASVAVFETRKDNMPVYAGYRHPTTGNAVYVAEDNTKTRGWEVEVSGELARGWQVQSGFTYVRSRKKNGDRLNADVPLRQFKLFSSYRVAALPQLTIGGGIRWQSSIRGSDYVGTEQYSGGYYQQGGFALVDLMANYRFSENLSVAFNVNNVLDKQYRSGRNLARHEYGPERNFSATLKYRF